MPRFAEPPCAQQQLVALSRPVENSHDHGLGRGLISSQPDAYGGKLDESEVVVGALLVTRGYGAEVLQLVEEALGQVAEAIQEGTKGRRVAAIGFRGNVGPRAAFGDLGAKAGLFNALDIEWLRRGESEGPQGWFIRQVSGRWWIPCRCDV